MPLILIDKPPGMTSHDVVAIIRKKTGTRQVGHTGTLDPMATGVMCVLTRRAVKAARYVSAENKSYTATLRLGYSTDTGDVTGNVTGRSGYVPEFDAILSVLPLFTGEIMQTPPAYSAIKRGGVKLCDAARRGETIAVEPRPVKILSLNALKAERPDEIILNVTCSKGTYIRALARDIGERLQSGAHLIALRRIRVGDTRIENCTTVEQFSESIKNLKKTEE